MFHCGVFYDFNIHTHVIPFWQGHPSFQRCSLSVSPFINQQSSSFTLQHLIATVTCRIESITVCRCHIEQCRCGCVCGSHVTESTQWDHPEMTLIMHALSKRIRLSSRLMLFCTVLDVIVVCQQNSMGWRRRIQTPEGSSVQRVISSHIGSEFRAWHFCCIFKDHRHNCEQGGGLIQPPALRDVKSDKQWAVVVA